MLRRKIPQAGRPAGLIYGNTAQFGKKTAAARRHNCAVLPYVFLWNFSLHLGQVMRILPLPRGTRTVWRQRGQRK